MHVKKGAVLFDSTIGTTPVSGAGTRMMWIPAKAAFRAGGVNSTQWDDVNIGGYSTAMGYKTMASSNYSTASGFASTASGIISMAVGDNTTASGINSTAMGGYTTASGTVSIAMGYSATAAGDNSIAMGHYVTSKSFGGLAVGLHNDTTNAANASNFNSLNRIFQIGNGTAPNARSNAMKGL